MRLILVDNMVLPGHHDLGALDVHPHLGLVSLAAVARRAGHHVTVYDPKRLVRSGRLDYDPTLYRRAAAELLADRPDAVGFTTLGCSFIFALRVAEELKRTAPDLPVLLGGPHATMLHREILERFGCFDVVVRHEAEETLPPVLEALEHRRFSHIPGVSWRTAPFAADVRATEGRPLVTDLDTLPEPAYDLYPVDELPLEYLRVEAGRGCPFSCTFCSTATFFQRSYRLKSPARLVADLDRLHRRYGTRDFKLEHDLFTVNRGKVLDFCDAVRDRGYTWRVSARVDCVDAELLERMAAAGCVALYLGIETGSPRLQQIIKKRLDLGLLPAALDHTERLGIAATVSFITGHPEEDPADQDATLDLLGDCLRRPRKACTTQLHVLLPEPGTAQHAALGGRLRYDGYRTEFNGWLLGEADETCVREHPDLFPTYHYYPGAMPREHHVFAVDLHRAVTELGHTVAAYLLRHFDGRLSTFTRRARDWHGRTGWEGPVDTGFVRAFVADTLGAGHHAHSLVRYVRDLRAVRRPARPADGGGGRYALSPRAVLFDGIHDCAALLGRIAALPAAGPPLGEPEAGEVGCRVVLAADAGCRDYAIDPATHAALSLFREPRTMGEVRSALGELAGGWEPGAEHLQLLADTGVIVPAGRRAEAGVHG
ncbi:radical SAM protein [Streptomyces sp. CB01881]|uniref:RiPP biosynthesis radical SAM protein ApyD n=1 Tax=Streptomyces sp. CB01881 TaxID=2078691 RepID=UPI0011E01FFC|nr:radical SAM protein [Streptomyces sp. CB01881]TYC66664.1 radical SAM protein [Streptomyces sp. CB01881]